MNLIISLITSITLYVFMASCAGKPDYPDVPRVGKQVVINTSALSEGVPVFYSFHEDGRRADLFVVMVDGVAKAYLDACRQCSPKKKGFRFVEGRLLCLACGETHLVRDIQGFDACHPIPLNVRREGSNLIIDKAELIRGLIYF